jgi:hypothetical protein
MDLRPEGLRSDATHDSLRKLQSFNNFMMGE